MDRYSIQKIVWDGEENWMDLRIVKRTFSSFLITASSSSSSSSQSLFCKDWKWGNFVFLQIAREWQTGTQAHTISSHTTEYICEKGRGVGEWFRQTKTKRIFTQNSNISSSRFLSVSGLKIFSTLTKSIFGHSIFAWAAVTLTPKCLLVGISRFMCDFNGSR